MEAGHLEARPVFVRLPGFQISGQRDERLPKDCKGWRTEGRSELGPGVCDCGIRLCSFPS